MNSVLDKIKKKNLHIEELKNDPRVSKVISFLCSKGLLLSNLDYGKAPKKIRIQDCLYVAQYFEPRIYSVLPACIIHYKNSFSDIHKIPKKLESIVNAIKKNVDIDEDYPGVEFSEMKRWANISLRDKRVKPASEKKVVKTFRLSPLTIKKLINLANARSKNITTTLEEIINEA